MSLRKWIAYSTLLSLFSERFMLNAGPVHLLYFYFVLGLNLVLLAAENSLWLPSGLLLLLGYLGASGVVGILRGTDSAIGFAKAFSGILPSALYFFAFLRYLKFDTEWCFATYARFAFYVAMLGFAYLPFQTTAVGQLQSVFSEPGNFCLVCLPAVFFYADEWLLSRRHGLRLLVLLSATILTVSSSGFLGLLFGLYLSTTRHRWAKLLGPVLVLVIGLGIYNASDFFRLRMDDTLLSIGKGDVTNVNQSTFGVVSNLFITQQVFAAHPLIGGGLGSHVVAYARYIDEVPGAMLFDAVGAGGLGRWDASSFGLRIVSEFGLLGIAGSFWFLFYFWPRGATVVERRIALSILCYVFIKSLRFGNYFNPEVFFFFSIYAVNGLRARGRVNALRQGTPETMPLLPADGAPAVPEAAHA